MSDEILGCFGEEKKQREKVIFSLFQDMILIGHGKRWWINITKVSPEKEVFVPLHYSIKGRYLQ